MKKIKLLTLAGILGVSLMSSASALAGVIWQCNVYGTDIDTAYVGLSSGGKYLTASGLSKVGYAQAKKVVEYMPDPAVAGCNVSSGNWSQDYFNSDGANYYVHWSSSNSIAGATVRFQDS